MQPEYNEPVTSIRARWLQIGDGRPPTAEEIARDILLAAIGPYKLTASEDGKAMASRYGAALAACYASLLDGVRAAIGVPAPSTDSAKS